MIKQPAIWHKAHDLQCDIGYMLSEINSKPMVFSKHMLEMVFKHINRELDDIKDLTNTKELGDNYDD